MAALQRDFLPEDLIPELQQHGGQGCIAVPADQSEQETIFLLQLARKHSFIRGVVGWVDLCSDRLRERLLFFSQFRLLRGVPHIVQAEADDRFLLRKDFLRGIAELPQFALTYDLLIYPRQLPAALELAATFPQQKFVLDHIAKPAIKTRKIDRWERDIRRLAALPNVFCRLSGLITEADWHRWQPGELIPYLD